VLSQYQGQETNLPHVLASSTLDVYGIVPPAPTVSQFFCNDNVINDWVTPAHVENKLTINSLNFSIPWKSKEEDFNPYILWYVREHVAGPPRGPINVGKSKGKGKDTKDEKMKTRDDDEDSEEGETIGKRFVNREAKKAKVQG
jgi:hypothetical protein